MAEWLKSDCAEFVLGRKGWDWKYTGGIVEISGIIRRRNCGAHFHKLYFINLGLVLYV